MSNCGYFASLVCLCPSLPLTRIFVYASSTNSVAHNASQFRTITPALLQNKPNLRPSIWERKKKKNPGEEESEDNDLNGVEPIPMPFYFSLPTIPSFTATNIRPSHHTFATTTTNNNKQQQTTNANVPNMV